MLLNFKVLFIKLIWYFCLWTDVHLIKFHYFFYQIVFTKLLKNFTFYKWNKCHKDLVKTYLGTDTAWNQDLTLNMQVINCWIGWTRWFIGFFSLTPFNLWFWYLDEYSSRDRRIIYFFVWIHLRYGSLVFVRLAEDWLMDYSVDNVYKSNRVWLLRLNER